MHNTSFTWYMSVRIGTQLLAGWITPLNSSSPVLPALPNAAQGTTMPFLASVQTA